MPSESDGGNGSTGTSGATSSARGGSDSNGGESRFNPAKDSQTANESLGLGTNPGDYGGTVSINGVTYGGSSSNGTSDVPNATPTAPSQQAAMDVAMGLLSRDSMTGQEAVRAANEATKDGTEETSSTRALVDAISKGEDISRIEGLNPNNPTQSVANLEASQNVSRVLGPAATALANMVSPGFSLAISAAKALQSNTLPGFLGATAGGMLTTKLGLPGWSGFGSELGRAAATGTTPSLWNAAQGAVAGMVGSGVSGSIGGVAGSIAGSAARSATNSAIGQARKS